MSIREYRSNMFSMLLKEPRYALEVYNALNDSQYENENDIEIFVLENGISLSIRNDASFLLGNSLNLYEQQATVNPNMPIRLLIYISELIKEYIEKNSLDIFDDKIIHIPNPKFVVFYNGVHTYPEISELHLSDNYYNTENNSQLELKCTVYNINPNNNEILKAKSPTLGYYIDFVERVHSAGPFGNDKNKLKKTLETVIAEFIRDNKLKDFLKKHGDEVIEMATLDFTFERREELIKKNYYNAGLKKGRIEKINAITKKVKKHKPIELIAEELEEKLDDVKPLYTAIITNPEKDANEIYSLLYESK